MGASISKGDPGDDAQGRVGITGDRLLFLGSPLDASKPGTRVRVRTTLSACFWLDWAGSDECAGAGSLWRRWRWWVWPHRHALCHHDHHYHYHHDDAPRYACAAAGHGP
ncbi:hypothetical protein Cmtc_02200 [Cupriavidus sp. TKC]|nr:hypothetical protein Cmtc_02200 [Cupriavidus sp. TKC]